MDQEIAPCVLCVDDDEMILEFMVRYLRMQEIFAITAKSGSEALEKLSQVGPSVKLVFLDLAMPDISGYEIAQTIRTDPDLWNLPIVIVTARSGPEVSKGIAAAGVREVIQKPFAPRLIRDALVYHGILEN
jgi:CheY-like chemotaxis protein